MTRKQTYTETVQIKVVELVAPVGGSGQPEPPPGGDLPDGVLEREHLAVVGVEVIEGQAADG
jgi:hypothetical protein